MPTAIQRTVGILGGGISGLSTAYYLRNTFGDAVKSVIFEKSGRCGGWIKTISRTDGKDSFHYELGPRTMRPVGDSGMNTLDLVEELGLSEQVLYLTKDHPATKTRYIFHNGKLVRLPSDFKTLFKKTEPFEHALVYAGLRDLFKWRRKMEDDSIHNFVQRRFGGDIANNVVDPVIRGICGGDARQISVKFLMKNLFEYEQKYGSALLGLILSRFGKKKEEPGGNVGYSNIALASLRENWSVWTLNGGLQLLPYALETEMKKDPNISIMNNCEVKHVRLGDRLKPDVIEIDYFPDLERKATETIACDHLISTVPCMELGKILRKSKPSHPTLWKLFETMGSTDIQVTNLMYTSTVMHREAFGFLVPSAEKSVEGLLGVVFDTCSFPQGADRQILTVMSKPSVEEGEHDIAKILKFLETTLEIKKAPDDHYIEVLRNCIPQYTVGHYEKVDALRRYIKAANLPLTLAGASYDGVSVNDAIYSGKRAAESYDVTDYATNF